MIMWRRLGVALVSIFVAAMQGGCQLLGCVREGTLVATPQGDRAIETLREGDEVWSIDSHGGRVAGRISRVTRGRGFEFVRITVGSHTLDVTPTHRIATALGWLRADDLGPGDALTTAHGVRSHCQIERVREDARVYDLSVWPHENYFAAGVLVHNKSIAPPTAKWQSLGPWGFVAGGHFGGDWYYQCTLDESGDGMWWAWEIDGYPGKQLETMSGPIAWGLERWEAEIEGRNDGGQVAWRLVGHFGGAMEFRIGDRRAEVRLARPVLLGKAIERGGMPEAPTPPENWHRWEDESWKPKRPSRRGLGEGAR